MPTITVYLSDLDAEIFSLRDHTGSYTKTFRKILFRYNKMMEQHDELLDPDELAFLAYHLTPVLDFTNRDLPEEIGFHVDNLRNTLDRRQRQMIPVDLDWEALGPRVKEMDYIQRCWLVDVLEAIASARAGE